MKLQSAIVSETTTHAVKCLLVLFQPQPQGRATDVGGRPFAGLALQAAIDLALVDSTDLEGLLLLIGVAVLAHFHGGSPSRKSGRVDLNHRPFGPEPNALAKLSYAPITSNHPNWRAEIVNVN